MSLYIFLHVAAAIASLIALIFVIIRPLPKSVTIPDKALTVGPEYMKIWAEKERVCMVLRRVPHIVIKIDKKVAKDLSERLTQLD